MAIQCKKNNYIYKHWKFWIFYFAFYKCGHKFTIRFEISSGWDN